MSKIKVEKSVYIESPSDAEERTVWPVSYADAKRPVLVQGVSTNGPSGKTTVFRRSVDNGGTWREIERWQPERPIDEHLCWNRGVGTTFLDPNCSRLVRFILEQQRDKRMPAYAKDAPWHKNRRLYYQISDDAGLTWQTPIMLIVDGYDEHHWAPEVWYGTNSIIPTGGPPAILSDGCICLPCCLVRADKNEDLGPEGLGMYQSCCLRGTWGKDLTSITWEAGSYTAVKRGQSCEGGDEGMVLPLRDGRLLMILRASTAHGDHPTGPCCKWHTLSRDGGRSWSAAEILRYDDGGPVYSPTAYSQILRSVRNGKVYLIANLMNYAYEFWASGSCWPRDILQIAELDEEKLCLRRETVTVIDQRQREQPRYIGFSNFCWYQDRQTRELIVFVTPMIPGWPGLVDHENMCRRPGCGVPGHSFRYAITVPD